MMTMLFFMVMMVVTMVMMVVVVVVLMLMLDTLSIEDRSPLVSFLPDRQGCHYRYSIHPMQIHDG